MNKWFLPCLVLCLGPLEAAQPPQALTVTPDRQIRYNTYDNGDRVPDYSYCGYLASEAPIPDLLADPDVPVVRVAPTGRDDTQRIQDALDYVGGLRCARTDSAAWSCWSAGTSAWRARS